MMVSVQCSFAEMVPVKEIKPHKKNRNKHPKNQIDRLAKLIAAHGFRHPIIVSRQSGMVVAGHGRLAAAKKLGMESVPVDFQGFKTIEEEYAFLQSDNAIALWAELDLSGINDDLADLGPDFDIDLLGIESFTVTPEEKETKAESKGESIVQCPNCGEQFQASANKV
jgi:hypothetical protein